VEWLDGASFEFPADVIAAEGSTLTVMAMGSRLNGPVPLLPARFKFLAFEEWWHRPVVRTLQSNANWSRKSVVKAVADVDAAHVDPEVPEDYANLKEGTFFNMRKTVGNGPALPVGGIQKALVRAVAHETILTVDRHRPDLVGVYCWQPLQERLRGDQYLCNRDPNGVSQPRKT
jgi:hypothetical protein